MFHFSIVIFSCWVIFWLYWLISAFGSKRNIGPSIRRFAGIRIVIIILALVLFRLLNTQNYSFENHIAANNETLQTAGLIIFLLGLLLAVWARLHLGRNWGMPMSQKQDPELVTSGPYHYIRHPIYSGILLAMLGTAIALSIYWLLIFAVSAVYFIYSAGVEEQLMLRQFPKVYQLYKSKTKMLIPFIF